MFRRIGLFCILFLLSGAVLVQGQTPDLALKYFEHGSKHYRQGDFDRAIELDAEDANAYIGRGSAKGFKGDLDGAIADYNRAIALDPKDANAYYGRGNSASPGKCICRSW